jgi:putative membrane protein
MDIMKMKGWIFLFGLAAFGWVACNNDDNKNTNTKTSLGKVDDNFVQNAAISNRAEIELGQLAASKGNDSLVKMFGQMMVTDHTTAQTELQTISGNYNDIDWPQNLDTAHQHLRTQLDSLSGYSFDSAYINSQVGDHTKTLLLFRTVLDSGKEQRVRDYATKYSPKIQNHLRMADSLRTVLVTKQQNTSRKN